MHDLRTVQQAVKVWATYNFGGGRAWQSLLGVAEEVGELEEHADIPGLPRLIGALNHAYLKREQGIRGNRDDHDAAIVDAVADITIYLLDFCNEVNIDFADALTQTWQRVGSRDWRRYPTNGRTA
jgi:NTP pyrophosphatase (non-canonical NTP hydrolase)